MKGTHLRRWGLLDKHGLVRSMRIDNRNPGDDWVEIPKEIGIHARIWCCTKEDGWRERIKVNFSVSRDRIDPDGKDSATVMVVFPVDVREQMGFVTDILVEVDEQEYVLQPEEPLLIKASSVSQISVRLVDPRLWDHKEHQIVFARERTESLSERLRREELEVV